MRSIRHLIAAGLYCVSTVALAVPDTVSTTMTHGELFRVVGGLVLVLFIIALLSWLIKRVNGVHLGLNQCFQTIATMSLGPKEKMVLLKVGGRHLLLGVGLGSVNLLCDFGEQLPEGFDRNNKSSFSDVLKSAIRKT